LNPRLRILLIAAVIVAALAALIWTLSTKYSTSPVTPVALPPAGEVSDAPSPQSSPLSAPTPPVELTPLVSPTVSTELSPTPTPNVGLAPPQQQATPPTSAPAQAFPQSPVAGAANGASLLIPVAGIRPQDLQDTFNNARSEGRTHDAIDIIAPRHTPVIATADGRIAKLFNSVKGGITIYQLSTDEKTVYYYAHLERYADGLREGHFARRGETIGYVGDSGNATPGNCHLHFQVYLVTDPKRIWDGTELNPYTLLRGNQ
jgi:murein DD-endopeptidase MepM/ murein hydrolase activator NlpD